MKYQSLHRILLTVFICFSVPSLIYSQAANDNCANAVTLTSSSSCTTTTGDMYNATNSATAPAGACGGATSTTTYDVWYKFTATSTTHAITVAILGNKLTSGSTYVEVLNGTCGSFTSSLGCQAVTNRLVLTNFTIGTVYYVRVYVTSAPTANPSSGWGFTICVQEPAANDKCASAVTLTSNSSCSNTAGSLDLVTPSTSGLPVGCESAGTHYDVWYKFTSVSTIQIISLSSLGANVTNPEIQLYSGTCGAFTSLACGTSSLTATGLTIGTTYYVRVSNVTSNPSGTGGVAGFNICVTHVLPPANDDCAGAITLSTATSCSNTAGTVVGATATTGLPSGCESGGTHYDVWYKFTAGSTYETITISSLGANFTNPEVQLYSGTCGSLTSLQCGTTTMTATGLTVGSIYYVRVSNVGSLITSTGSFSICVYHPAASSYDYSKSYVNITRNNGGGTINTGDTLEIRGTVAVQNISSSSLDSLAFIDTLYAGGGVKFISGSIALRTNEGTIYKSLTDAVSDDEGYLYTSGSDTVIRVNFGSGASATARGRLTGTSKPKVYTSACIIMATYRVVVYAAYGSTLNLGRGLITMKDTKTGISGNLSFSNRNVIVYSSPGLCPNSVSATNAIGGDFNGTFGVPATAAPLARNRGTSSNVPGYIYKPFTSTGGPNDYYYAIANNTSQTFTTSNTWAKPDATYRVFSLWDISGDHSGASNTTKGNPPCDTTQPVSATNPCGYMLVINSAYKTDTAFQYSVTNLCPNTYYEISAWFKNVCYKCGCDSNGTGATGAGYIPTGAGDSSGVKPNIAFDINGTDYYTTGNLQYKGLGGTQTGSDSLNIWVKRGFTYKTGSLQTSFTLTLRNNAPGGGGNDWAIDDIALATCSPDVTVTPGPNPFVCDSNTVDVGATIASYFDNYVYYSWEKSTDNGTTWASTGVTGGPVTPTWNGSAWTYNVAYPTFVAYAADSGSQYRVVVASTASNISSSSCSFSGGAKITLTVDPCNTILDVDLLSFKGRNINNSAILYFTTSKEKEPVTYRIQKSKDGSNFVTIGEVTGYQNPSYEQNNYTYTDAEPLDNLTWYRINIIKPQSNKHKYSKVIQLINNNAGLQIESLINPFSSRVKFDLVSDGDGLVQVEILDQYQHKLKGANYNLTKGRNNISITNTDNLPAGFYILRVTSGNYTINRKIIKRG